MLNFIISGKIKKIKSNIKNKSSDEILNSTIYSLLDYRYALCLSLPTCSSKQKHFLTVKSDSHFTFCHFYVILSLTFWKYLVFENTLLRRKALFPIKSPSLKLQQMNDKKFHSIWNTFPWKYLLLFHFEKILEIYGIEYNMQCDFKGCGC